MFISRKKFEAELEKAYRNGFDQAMDRRNMDDQFRSINERIDRLADMINKPKPVGFETGERKC